MKVQGKVSRAEVRSWPDTSLVSIALANTDEDEIDDDFAARVCASRWIDGVEGYGHPTQEWFGPDTIVIAKQDGIDWHEVTP